MHFYRGKLSRKDLFDLDSLAKEQFWIKIDMSTLDCKESFKDIWRGKKQNGGGRHLQLGPRSTLNILA